MTWKTKLKITGPSGSSLNFDGELTTEQKDAVIAALDLPGCTIGKSSAEPFGYFKSEPFGWTDCAETDEGARPLFELATVQAVEKQRDELNRLCEFNQRMIDELLKQRDELLATIIAAASLAYHGSPAKALLDDAIASVKDQFRGATEMMKGSAA